MQAEQIPSHQTFFETIVTIHNIYYDCSTKNLWFKNKQMIYIAPASGKNQDALKIFLTDTVNDCKQISLFHVRLDIQLKIFLSWPFNKKNIECCRV